jgi:hypothetical protein
VPTAAAERYRAATDADSERVLGYDRRYRERLRETSLTFAPGESAYGEGVSLPR